MGISQKSRKKWEWVVVSPTSFQKLDFDDSRKSNDAGMILLRPRTVWTKFIAAFRENDFLGNRKNVCGPFTMTANQAKLSN